MMDTMPEESPMNGNGHVNGNGNGHVNGSGKKLSIVSTMYDRGGKGYLDKTEQQIRDLDTENLGHVSNEKVYDLMKSQIEARNALYKTKRILLVVSIFLVILILTSLGTSWAAAELAKDSSLRKRSDDVVVNEDELMSKDGTVAVGVHTIGHEIQLEEHDHGGGIADHACVSSTEVIEVWEEIAGEFEVHLILVKDQTLKETDDTLKKMANEDLIPLTGAKSFGDQLCFTSFNEIAACVAFNDTSCSEELEDDDMVTMTFPNSHITS